MAGTDVPSGASQYLSKARELSIRLYKKSAEVTWKFQHFLRHLTTGVSVNAVTRAYVLLLILILVAGNTRAVVSPFQSVEWFWIIISCTTFGIFNFNANRLSSNEFTIQSMTAGYAIVLFLYGSFAIWPSSLLVQLPLVMELIGIFTLLFLSSVAGCLTGGMVQTSSLGDSFFRHHILPYMKDSNSKIHLLHWAESGKVRIIKPEDIRIKWDNTQKMLLLKDEPLYYFAPVRISDIHIKPAINQMLSLIDNLPIPRKNALRNYRSDFTKAHERISDLHLVQKITYENRHRLTDISSVIEIQHSPITLENNKSVHKFSWPARDLPWNITYSGTEPALHQALNPHNNPKSKEQIEQLEKTLTSIALPNFKGEQILQGIFFQRSFTNLMLHLRKNIPHGESSEAALHRRVMQNCISWFERERNLPVFSIPTLQIGAVTFEQWGRVLDKATKDPTSLLIDMYNLLSKHTEDLPGQNKLASRAHNTLENGMKMFRLSTAQEPISSNQGISGAKVQWRSHGGLERKVAMQTVLCQWILFSSLFANPEELAL